MSIQESFTAFESHEFAARLESVERDLRRQLDAVQTAANATGSERLFRACELLRDAIYEVWAVRGAMERNDEGVDQWASVR